MFTPFVMDQMQPMTQMAGAAACPYTKPPLGSETDVLYYATPATPGNPEVLQLAHVRAKV